jgi:hypothetical protein
VKHTWWGEDPLILMRHKALIRPRMEYGAFLFNKLKKKQLLKLKEI